MAPRAERRAVQGRAGSEKALGRLPVRAALARWVGRVLLACLRRLGRAGTTLPGRVALRVEPRLPALLAERLPGGVALVAGTNGKTTTAGMLAQVLTAAGWRLAHNRGGANLRSGIATALLAAPLPGARAALLEVDEATMPYAGALGARLAVITNFFRDQLDRYGELETARARVAAGLAAMRPGAPAVLNADDPLVASLGAAGGRPAVYFGVDPRVGGAVHPGGGPSDVPACPRCGGELDYAARLYAHLGAYRCAACGYARPQPDVLVVDWRPATSAAAGSIGLLTPGGVLRCTLRLPGLYSAYNAAAAAAAALALGVAPAAVVDGLAAFRQAFGRTERVAWRGRSVCLTLVKNPVGCTLALQAALADPAPEKALVLALNDGLADGTDVSWVWDAELEALGEGASGFAVVVASGRRAEDMALRLKYAGVPTAQLRLVADPLEATLAAAEALPEGGTVHVLPTYTAMLALRAGLARRGLVPPLWEA